MNSTFYWALLAVLVLTTYVASDESDSDDSDSDDSGSKPKAHSHEDHKTDFDEACECDQPIGTECHSEFSRGLEHIGYELPKNQRTTWLNWVTGLKQTTLKNTALTTQQKCSSIHYSLQAFKTTNPTIFTAVQYKSIKSYGRDWMQISDIEFLAYSYMDETIWSAISLNGTDWCELFNSLQTAAGSDTTVITKVNSLIIQLQITLKNTNMTQNVQLSTVYTQLDSFFTTNPSYKAAFLNTAIKNYYTIQAFMDVSKKYQQSTGFDAIVTGTETTCPLLIAIKPKLTDNTIPENDKKYLREFYDIILEGFNSEPDTTLKLKMFSQQFHHLKKYIPNIRQYFESTSLGTWGTIGELNYVSTIINPEFDTTIQAMGALIDIPIGGTWEDTPFIQSIYASFEWGVSYEFFGFKWGLTMQALLKSAYLKNQIGPVIASTSYSITIKFKKIFDILQLYLDGYTTQNQWIFTCIPINGWGGTMSDMMKKSRCGSYKPWKCPGIRRSCHDHRYKVLEKDCDGNDQFTLGWEQFINGITYDNTTNTTDPDLPTYTGYFIKIKQVVDDDQQKGPQKASKLCQLQDELKGKLTGPNQDKVARILYGNWGHAKKFCECQGCSSECNTTCTMGGCSKAIPPTTCGHCICAYTNGTICTPKPIVTTTPIGGLTTIAPGSGGSTSSSGGSGGNSTTAAPGGGTTVPGNTTGPCEDNYRRTCDATEDQACRDCRLAYEQQQVDAINNDPSSTFTAAVYPFIATMSDLERHTLLGELAPQFVTYGANPTPPTEPSGRKKRQAPAAFDSRTQWPACANVINTIRAQPGCGCCWAQSSSQVISDRLCIERSKLNYVLDNVLVSAMDLLACTPLSPSVTDSDGNGVADNCDGNGAYFAYQYANTNRVVSGGNYATHQGCKPYKWPGKDYIAPNSGVQKAPTCTQGCIMTWPDTYTKSKDYMTSVQAAFIDPDLALADRLSAMMNEIQVRGSITIKMNLPPTFFDHKVGIYSYNGGPYNESWHAMRLIGWGNGPDRNGVNMDYWIVANSWGTTWGEQGFVRIQKGVDLGQIEKYATFPYVVPSQTTPACFPPPETSLVAIEDSGNFANFVVNPLWTGGSCQCNGNVKRLALRTAPVAAISTPAVQIQCGGFMINFCAISTWGEQFTQTPGIQNTIGSAAIQTWCATNDVATEDGDCLSYLILTSGSLTGNINNGVYTAAEGAGQPVNAKDANGAYVYIPLRAVSCNGCANIANLNCIGP